MATDDLRHGRAYTARPVAGSIPDQELDELAGRLREARRAKGLTQQQVAVALHVSRRAVSEWETGARKPHVALPGLAALYDVTTTFLLYGVEPSSIELRRLADDVAATRADLAALAESTARSFDELQRLLVDALLHD